MPTDIALTHTSWFSITGRNKVTQSCPASGTKHPEQTTMGCHLKVPCGMRGSPTWSCLTWATERRLTQPGSPQKVNDMDAKCCAIL